MLMLLDSDPCFPQLDGPWAGNACSLVMQEHNKLSLQTSELMNCDRESHAPLLASSLCRHGYSPYLNTASSTVLFQPLSTASVRNSVVYSAVVLVPCHSCGNCSEMSLPPAGYSKTSLICLVKYMKKERTWGSLNPDRQSPLQCSPCDGHYECTPSSLVCESFGLLSEIDVTLS